MLTSFAPSPIASKGAFVLRLTSLTTSAFWSGETRPEDQLGPGDTTILGLTADDRLAHHSQFQEDARALLLQRKSQAPTVDDQGQFLYVSTHPLVLDRE
jgi:hypothetical protein